MLYGNKAQGFKSLTKDKYLATFKSESKSDLGEGPVKSVAEKPTQGLEPVLSWIPNGSLIYSVQTVEERKPKSKEEKIKVRKVVMWEKNGLRHGEFNLSGEGRGRELGLEQEVLSLAWNRNSKVLAVAVAEG